MNDRLGAFEQLCIRSWRRQLSEANEQRPPARSQPLYNTTAVAELLDLTPEKVRELAAGVRPRRVVHGMPMYGPAEVDVIRAVAQRGF